MWMSPNGECYSTILSQTVFFFDMPKNQSLAYHLKNLFHPSKLHEFRYSTHSYRNYVFTCFGYGNRYSSNLTSIISREFGISVIDEIIKILHHRYLCTCQNVILTKFKRFIFFPSYLWKSLPNWKQNDKQKKTEGFFENFCSLQSQAWRVCPLLVETAN